MGSKRRGFLALCAGIVVVLARGSDEAARLLARGADELIAGTKSSDEAKSSGSAIDDLVTAGTRQYRREQLKSLLDDESRSDTFRLNPGWYGGYTIEPTVYTDLEIRFETRFGEPIDAFVLGKQSFEHYEREGQLDSGSLWAVYRETSTTATVDLEANTEYVLLFDHTRAGLTAPGDDNVIIDAEVSLGLVQ